MTSSLPQEKSKKKSEFSTAIKHFLTCNDNKTYNPAAIGFGVALLCLCFFQGWDTLGAKNPFDALKFGGGVAAICAAFGIAQKLDPDRTEAG